MRKFLHDFDQGVTKVVQAWPDSVRPLMLFASLIGRPVFTISIGTLIAGVGWGRSNASLLQTGLMIVATIIVGSLIKVLLRRNRPITDYVAHMRFSTYSLPSGHSVGSVVAYGGLAYFAGMLLPLPWNVIAAVLLALAGVVVGVSRIYLGAHYPTDVVAGWLLGGFGLGVVIFMIQPVA